MTTATLGFAIQSDSAVAAKERLDQMSGASKRAESATNALNAASQRSSNGNRALAQATNMVATAQTKAAVATKATTAALNAQRAAARSVAFQQRQLSFQLIDIGQALATAPTMGIYALQNLGFQVAQIGQLYMGQGGFNAAIRDSARQVGAFAARIAPLAAAAGTVAIGFAGLTYEINRTGKESVSMADVMLASFQLIKEGIYDLVRPAIASILPWWNRYWNQLVKNTSEYINGIIGSFVGAYEEIKAAWSGLPSYFGDLGIRTAQSFLDGVAKLARETLAIYNDLAYKITKKTGINVPAIDAGIYAPKLENPFFDSQYEPGKAFVDAFNRDYAGEAFDAIAKRAREIASATDEITGAAGKAADAWRGLRRTVGDTADKLQQRVSNLGQSIGGIFRGLIDETLTWKDAALNAIQSVLGFLHQQNLDRGGAGLFGGGLFGSILNGFFGLAKGGVLSGGQVTPFANGGVVTRPTVFPMANGTGLMGEAGPEAVIPLRRGPNGKLGVEGFAAANSNVTPAANQNVTVDVRVWVDDDGTIQAVAENAAVNVVREAAPGIASAGAKQAAKDLSPGGKSARAFQQSYPGLSPRSRRAS